MNVTKKKIAKLLSNELRINFNQGALFLDSFLNIIKNNVDKKDVKIKNFGVFYPKKTIKRVGRNPKTLQKFNINSFKKISFRPSSNVKSSIN